MIYSAPYELTKGTKTSVGFDIQATETTTIKGFDNAIISTGLFIAGFEPQEFALVTLRSGKGFNDNLTCHIGIIDPDYRGEVKVKVFNSGPITKTIEAGTRFAQLTILKHEIVAPLRVQKTTYERYTTERGEGGFGHTGN